MRTLFEERLEFLRDDVIDSIIVFLKNHNGEYKGDIKTEIWYNVDKGELVRGKVTRLYIAKEDAWGNVNVFAVLNDSPVTINIRMYDLRDICRLADELNGLNK